MKKKIETIMFGESPVYRRRCYAIDLPTYNTLVYYNIILHIHVHRYIDKNPGKTFCKHTPRVQSAHARAWLIFKNTIYLVPVWLCLILLY